MSLGLSFMLGANYERKRQKLQQELKLDCKQHVAKEMESKNSETRPQPQGLSLPIHDNLSVKEKLREERNREYNVFLQNKTQIRRTGQVHASSNPPPFHKEQPQKRDAATLTEAGENDKGKRTWDPGHQGQRRWQPHSPKQPYSSEDDVMEDEDEDLKVKHKWRKDGHPAGPENNEERRRREPKTNSLQMPDNMRATRRSRSAANKETEFATGLLIGTKDDPTASHRRKEAYKQELLKQIAEQQKNKMMEKKLELRVAATGSTDPEKEPNRIMQFGPVNRQQDSWRRSGLDLTARGKDPHQRPSDSKLTEHTELGGSQSKVDTALSQPTCTAPPHGVSSLDSFTGGHHREFSDMLGELAIPRIASVPPPLPPAIPNVYTTPYDAAYYYYGIRNPLDPHIPNYQNGWRRRESGNFHSPPHHPRTLRPSDLADTTDQRRASSLDAGQVLPDKSNQRTESVRSYQEALREQMREKEESKRRAKEEKERYDAKIEAEMVAYNPWGKSGGGAPIKDQKGNLFSDLNQMHKTNEESYKNPLARNSEVRTPRPHRLSVVSEGVSDQPTPQQLDAQERYKQALKQQIDENRRKRAEEREQMRMEEEKEEKRLLEQRTRIQWEYEEELKKQQKQKNVEHKLEKQRWIHEPKTLRREEEKKPKQEQEIAESIRDIEEKMAHLPYEKEPSPPVPGQQKKQTNIVVSRPSSVASQLSTKTEESEPAAQSQPAPLQAGHQDVVRELSALRQYLREEKRQLEAQLGRSDGQEGHYTPPNRRRARRRADAREPLQQQPDQAPAGRLYSGTARVNMDNIREFNRLKHRDTASREEVRHMYPDPPTDAQSLDIQQQVLLREQRRKIRRMKREEEQELLELQQSCYYDGKPGRFTHTDALLPSEATFIDVYSSKEQFHEQKPRQPSGDPQRRTATRRTRDYDEAATATKQKAPQIQLEAQLLTESKVQAYNQQLIRRQGSHASEQDDRTEALAGDETDAASLRSALGSPTSMETVTTEPWLRPGTSDDVKRSGSGPRPNRGMDAPPWLTHGIA